MPNPTLSHYWKRASTSTNDPRAARKKIAEETWAALERGEYSVKKTSYDLATKMERSLRGTKYYDPDSLLSTWKHWNASAAIDMPTQISIFEMSTLDGARYLASSRMPSHLQKIGILNFASATLEGGGWLTGAQAQEESIARSSTLYPTLMKDDPQIFYALHKRDKKNGFYSHAMIYSPGVVLFRDDGGAWTPPVEVDVLTSAAVNAGEVRRKLGGASSAGTLETKIEKEMKERMGRLLFLFEKEGVKNLVLGSFGTGVFQNNVDAVARIWAELLDVPNARFKDSFAHIVFAIIGRETFVKFGDSFNATTAHITASRS